MAQFDYYATWDDDWKLLQSLLDETGAALIPDKWYETQRVEIYDSLNEELNRQLRCKGRMFVFPRPLRMSVRSGLVKQKGGPKTGWYSVYPDEIGENLDLSLSGCFEMDGIPSLSNGILSYMLEYFNHETNEWQRPSPELKQFYIQVRKLFRRQMTKVNVDGVNLWLGAEAKSMYESGKVQIMLYGTWRKVST